MVLGVALVVVVVQMSATLPVAVRRRLLGGAILVAVGSVGIEALSGLVLDSAGRGWGYAVLYHAEEFVEMIGYILLSTAGVLILQVGDRGRSLVVMLSDEQAEARPGFVGAS